jgi:hypothetical protein
MLFGPTSRSDGEENCTTCNWPVHRGSAGHKGRLHVYNNQGVSIGYVCEKCRFKTRLASIKVVVVKCIIRAHPSSVFVGFNGPPYTCGNTRALLFLLGFA